MNTVKKQDTTFEYNGNARVAQYCTFDSVSDFHDFVATQLETLSKANQGVAEQVRWNANRRITQGTKWYGTPEPKDVKELASHSKFLGMHLVKHVQEKIKQHLAAYIQMTKVRVVEKPKLTYNDKGLGVFSFDRAMMGMYRQQPTAKKPPLQGLISQLQIALDRGNKATAIRKVYQCFEDQNHSAPTLQLYVMAGANAQVDGDELLYIGLACAQLVEFMEDRGIAVGVNLLLGTYFDEIFSVANIHLKGFEDRLDTNQLLLLSSDPRHFRYRGFQSLVAISDYFDRRIPSSLGSIEADMGKLFIHALDPEAILFEQSYSLDSAVQEVTKIISSYTQKINTS